MSLYKYRVLLDMSCLTHVRTTKTFIEYKSQTYTVKVEEDGRFVVKTSCREYKGAGIEALKGWLPEYTSRSLFEPGGHAEGYNPKKATQL